MKLNQFQVLYHIFNTFGCFAGSFRVTDIDLWRCGFWMLSAGVGDFFFLEILRNLGFRQPLHGDGRFICSVNVTSSLTLFVNRTVKDELEALCVLLY